MTSRTGSWKRSAVRMMRPFASAAEITQSRSAPEKLSPRSSCTPGERPTRIERVWPRLVGSSAAKMFTPGRLHSMKQRKMFTPGRLHSMKQLQKLGWGFIDQAASSATSLLLVVVGGHLLGPSKLGEIVLGFAGYILLLGLGRVLVSQPLVVSSSALTPTSAAAATATSAGLTMTVLLTAAGSSVIAALGMLLGGSAGHGLLLFAPWMIWALLQDYWRSILFRDGRGRAAAVNDTVWLVVMVAGLAATWNMKSEWSVVGSWGFGAVVGTFLGFAQTGVRPLSLTRSWSSWHRDAWQFGRWLFAEAIAYYAGTQAAVFVIAGLLGTAAIGGLRAVQTVFGPITVLAPAVSLPMLPVLVRRLEHSMVRAKVFAVQISILLVGATLAYIAILSLAGSETILGIVFGHGFERYANLVLPVALLQVAEAVNHGFRLLLLAARRGRMMLFMQVLAGFLSLVFVAASASTRGLTAAAWSLALARLVVTACLVVSALGLRSPRVLR
jgi:O-antigen/teichoic acid export membrane protein